MNPEQDAAGWLYALNENLASTQADSNPSRTTRAEPGVKVNPAGLWVIETAFQADSMHEGEWKVRETPVKA